MGDGDGDAVDDAFVPLKFDGGRYGKRGYPLETVAELANYQKLLIEVAKQEWLAQNPDRERVYKGFEDSLELRLTRVEIGSVMPYTVTGVSDVSEFVETVREAIRSLFAFVVEKRHLPTGLRDGVREAVKRLGTTLRDDEVLFVKATSGAEVKYTQAIRTQMIANEEVGEIEREGDLPGKVVEINPDDQRFEFQMIDGRTIPARFAEPNFWKTLIPFVSTSVEGRIVRFKAKYIESLAGEVLRIENVADVEEFLDSGSSWTPRLLELLRLQSGWFDGEGESIGMPAIEYAREVLRRASENSTPLPAIFPTPAGGVQLELLSGTRHLELTISPDLLIEGYILDSASGEDDEVEIGSLDEAAAFIGRWSSD